MAAVYYGKWVLIPSGEVITNGAVRVEGGLITEAGFRSTVHRAADDRVVNLGDVLLMPGLINMHTHLEESALRGAVREPDETFASWIAKKDSRLRQATTEALLPAVRLGIRESLAGGVTTIVDSSRTGVSLPVIKDEPTRAWVIHEFHEGEDQVEFRRTFDMRARIAEGADRLRLGIGPYALFSLSPPGHKALIDIARTRECLWASHLAESAEELQAFSEQTGDLYFYVTRRRGWTYGASSMGPLHYAITAGLIPNGAVLFHCNYAGGHELSLLSAKNVSIVVSGSYTEMLGHKPLSLDVALGRRVNLCVGTESMPESLSGGLFDELHFLKSRYPHLSAQELLRWVTVNPARALRMSGKLGVLAPGACADIIAVSFAHSSSEDILEELLQEQPVLRFVMVNGEEVIEDY